MSESRINTDSAREGDSVLPFAPEERYVYSRRDTSNPALQRSANVVLWHTPEPVGVGCPNPSGRGNPAPTIADISVTGDSIPPLAPEGRHVW